MALYAVEHELSGFTIIAVRNGIEVRSGRVRLSVQREVDPELSV